MRISLLPTALLGGSVSVKLVDLLGGKMLYKLRHTGLNGALVRGTKRQVSDPSQLKPVEGRTPID